MRTGTVLYTPAARLSGGDSFVYRSATTREAVASGNGQRHRRGQSRTSRPSVNAGVDQAITFPINVVSLAGTATDDGMPGPG